MDKKVINKIQKGLEAEKGKIEQELEKFTKKEGSKGKRTTKFTDLGDSSDDNAKEIDIYATNLSVVKVLEKDLKDIEATLKRIKDGSYGICKYCGEEIGEKRLLARPVSSACIACKNKLQGGQ